MPTLEFLWLLSRLELIETSGWYVITHEKERKREQRRANRMNRPRRR